MRFVTFLALFLLMNISCARADSSQAREIARLNNCAPKKVEIFQQKTGAAGSTTFRVACNTPKAVDEKAPQMATAVLVQCSGSLCDFVRPLYDTSN